MICASIFDEIPNLHAKGLAPFLQRGQLRVVTLPEVPKDGRVIDFEALRELALRNLAPLHHIREQ